MNTRLRNLWEKLRSSYWFIPSLMVVGAMVLSAMTLNRDLQGDVAWLSHFKWIRRTEPEGARSLLSTVAGAMSTVTGVVFSIGMVALQLASQQFGPRILYNFMRDRRNQFVFGTFISTYLYCLLVLRTIRQGGRDFVPEFSILVALFLVILSLGVLIFFIHHVSLSIQAMSIIASIRADLDRVIDRLLPRTPREHESSMPEGMDHRAELPEGFDRCARPVPARCSGYVQAIDYPGLIELATRSDLILRLHYRPGKFVVDGSTLADAWPPDRIPGNVEKKINQAFMLGRKRTPEQDLEFLINELVEIAIRALSPGINDPFTAMACIDNLGAALTKVVRRPFLSPWCRDSDGHLRLLMPGFSFEGLVDAAYNQIRQHSRGNVAVTIRLLESIGIVLQESLREDQRQVLLRHAGMVERSREAVPEESDRNDIRERYLALFEVL